MFKEARYDARTLDREINSRPSPKYHRLDVWSWKKSLSSPYLSFRIDKMAVGSGFPVPGNLSVNCHYTFFPFVNRYYFGDQLRKSEVAYSVLGNNRRFCHLWSGFTPCALRQGHGQTKLNVKSIARPMSTEFLGQIHWDAVQNIRRTSKSKSIPCVSYS